MKCLCFSDSHGSSSRMRAALNMHPDAEVVFFLGDGLSDIEPFVTQNSNRAWIYVRGNCDFSPPTLPGKLKRVEEITLEGYKILLTHGDLSGVKSGDDGILRLAEAACADIVLYGHTHIPRESFVRTESGREVYLFNPGSIGHDYPAPSSYGIITLSESGVLFSHGSFV